MSLTIGLDIGGTKIAGGVLDDRGRILLEGRRDTPADNPDDIASAAGDLARELAGRAHAGEGTGGTGEDVVAVGVACAGFVDAAGAVVLFAPNLAWRDEPLKERLQEMVDLPVTIENDANAAAWGEFRVGAASDADDMVLVTVGTGVGGGIVSDGSLLRGAYGLGGELGHMRVVPGGHRCGCGNRGCLEMYASGNALVREARELVASGTPHAGLMAELCGGDADRLEGAHVTTAAQRGDPAARELLEDLGTWLGEGIASIGAILDPELVVIGGGVADAGDLLLEPTRGAFSRNVIGRGHRPVPELRIAELGNSAGLIGAGVLAAEVATR